MMITMMMMMMNMMMIMLMILIMMMMMMAYQHISTIHIPTWWMKGGNMRQSHSNHV